MAGMTTRILVVEDDPDIAELVARYLDKAASSTDRVASGRDALRRDCGQAARPAGARPDAAACRRPRSLPARARERRRPPRIPIIMLTARAEESERIVGLELGADDYLAKPFSPNELVARVRALLRRAQRGRRRRRPDARLRPDRRRHRAPRRVVWTARRDADRQGIPAARVSAAAPRPRAVARSCC